MWSGSGKRKQNRQGQDIGLERPTFQVERLEKQAKIKREGGGLRKNKTEMKKESTIRSEV